MVNRDFKLIACIADVHIGNKAISWKEYKYQLKHGIIDKKGAWFTQGDVKVGQGHENAVAFIEQNPEYAKKIEKQLRDLLFPGQVLKTKEGVPVVSEEKTSSRKKEVKSDSDDKNESEKSDDSKNPVEVSEDTALF